MNSSINFSSNYKYYYDRMTKKDNNKEESVNGGNGQTSAAEKTENNNQNQSNKAQASLEDNKKGTDIVTNYAQAFINHQQEKNVTDKAFSFAHKSDALQKELEHQQIAFTPASSENKIASNSAPNSTLTGTIKDKEGKEANFTAKYGADGKLTEFKIDGDNSMTYKYSYGEKGEFTETALNELGFITETVYNKGGSVKSYKQFSDVNSYNNNDAIIVKNYTYTINDNGNAVQTMTDSTGNTKSIEFKNGKYEKLTNTSNNSKAPEKTETQKTPEKAETPKTPEKTETQKTPEKAETPKTPEKTETQKAPEEIRFDSIFSYYGDIASKRKSNLNIKYVIDIPLFDTFNIPKTGKPGEMKTGKGDYGTGRKDDYVARYDEQGRISSIETYNNTMGSSIVTYTYGKNGDWTESIEYNETKVILDTTYHFDGTIKEHKEYMNKEAKDSGNAIISRKYSYYSDTNGNPVEVLYNETSGRYVKTTYDIKTDTYKEENYSKEEMLQSAFAFDGSKAAAYKSVLNVNYVIDNPINEIFNIPKTSNPNSMHTGTGKYGTGREDDYVARYDAQGRLSSIESYNKTYGETKFTFTYDENGEWTISEMNKDNQVIIDTTYNKDGSIKHHEEYINQEAKEKGNAIIARNYTYYIDAQGCPVQEMTNSANVRIVTTLLDDGTYKKDRTEL